MVVFCERCGRQLDGEIPLCNNCGVDAKAALPDEAPLTKQSSPNNKPDEVTISKKKLVTVAGVIILVFVITLFSSLFLANIMWQPSSSIQSSSPPANRNTQPDEIADSAARSSEDTSVSGFIFPDSNSRYLTRAEIQQLNDWECYIARNEIFARQGRGFRNQDLKDYFESQDWYHEQYSPEEYDTMPSTLNEYENQNARLILEIEKERGSIYAK